MGKKKKKPAKPEPRLVIVPPQIAKEPSALEQFPEHARLLGLIIAESTDIEQRLATLLGLRMGTEEDVILPMLYAVGSGKARLDATWAAFERLLRKDAHEKDVIQNAITIAKKLLEKRNDFAHQHYHVDAGKVGLVRMKFIGSGKPFWRELTLDEMQRVFTEMKALSRSLAYLVAREFLLRPPKVRPAEPQPSNPPS